MEIRKGNEKLWKRPNEWIYRDQKGIINCLDIYYRQTCKSVISYYNIFINRQTCKSVISYYNIFIL